MAWFSFYCECQDKVGMGIYFIENAEIRYGWGFISLKRPKFGRTGDLFHLKKC